MNAVGASYTLPADKQPALRRAVAVTWASGVHFRHREPNETFPYGYRRAVLIGFLCGAVALFGFGLFMLGDAAIKLIEAEHPSVQTVSVFGMPVWQGWLMIAVLIYSVIPPLVLGRMKMPLARELHDKVLHVSATLDKGDWLSGIAGVAGIVGIASGLWWADSAAAAFISIIRDGLENLRNSVEQLMNKRPSDIEGDGEDPAIDKLQQALERLDWVAQARVRLREDGDVLTGEAFLVAVDGENLLERMEEARRVPGTVDWRLHDISMVPVRRLE